MSISQDCITTPFTGTMQDFTTNLCDRYCTPVGTDHVYIGLLSDARNTRKYQIRKFADGKCWMVADLLGGSCANQYQGNAVAAAACADILGWRLPTTTEYITLNNMTGNVLNNFWILKWLGASSGWCGGCKVNVGQNPCYCGQNAGRCCAHYHALNGSFTICQPANNNNNPRYWLVSTGSQLTRIG